METLLLIFLFTSLGCWFFIGVKAIRELTDRAILKAYDKKLAYCKELKHDC